VTKTRITVSDSELERECKRLNAELQELCLELALVVDAKPTQGELDALARDIAITKSIASRIGEKSLELGRRIRDLWMSLHQARPRGQQEPVS
jgi:hypothetical protein